MGYVEFQVRYLQLLARQQQQGSEANWQQAISRTRGANPANRVRGHHP